MKAKAFLLGILATAVLSAAPAQAREFGLYFGSNSGQPYVEAYVNLFVSDVLNSDGSYTILGTDGRVRFSGGSTLYSNVIGVAPLGAAQGYGDNKVFPHTSEMSDGQHKYFSSEGVNLLTDNQMMINLFSAKDFFGFPQFFDPVVQVYKTSDIKASIQDSYVNWRVSVNAIALPSNPTTPDPITPVPEPATWAMMLVGFGLIGAASRYRRRSTTASIA